MSMKGIYGLQESRESKKPTGKASVKKPDSYGFLPFLLIKSITENFLFYPLRDQHDLHRIRGLLRCLECFLPILQLELMGDLSVSFDQPVLDSLDHCRECQRG